MITDIKWGHDDEMPSKVFSPSFSVRIMSVFCISYLLSLVLLVWLLQLHYLLHYCSSSVYFILTQFLAPLLLLELLRYWHALNGHSSILISGSAHVSGISFSSLILFLSLFLFPQFCHWFEWGDADWRKRITWLLSHVNSLTLRWIEKGSELSVSETKWLN